MNKLTELWIKVTGEREIEEYSKEVRDLYDYTIQLEEDYKNELEENLKLSELWRKSQEEKRQLETNRDEALKFIKYEWYYDGTPIDKIEEILERGKE